MNLDQEDFWKTFAVMIQLGAILAILLIYFQRLWHVATHMFTDPPPAASSSACWSRFFPP